MRRRHVDVVDAASEHGLRDARVLRLRAHDDGVGVQAAEVAEVAVPQVDAHRARPGDGTGLGEVPSRDDDLRDVPAQPGDDLPADRAVAAEHRDPSHRRAVTSQAAPRSRTAPSRSNGRSAATKDSTISSLSP